MGAQTLLEKLEKAKPTGKNSWLACCSAHDDKTPSLSIRELSDGRVLIHCFAECSVESVLDAVGLTFDDIAPPELLEQRQHRRGLKRPFHAGDVLEALATEARIVAVTAMALRRGPLSEVDHARLLVAYQRIEAGRSLALG